MEFWLSGEVQSDVADAFRPALVDVENALNEAFTDLDVGPLKTWGFIAIIREAESPLYPEVRKYHKRDSSLEFRLVIEHDVFKRSDDVLARHLLMAALLRSVNYARKLAPAAVDLDRINQVMLDVAHANGWIRPH